METNKHNLIKVVVTPPFFVLGALDPTSTGAHWIDFNSYTATNQFPIFIAQNMTNGPFSGLYRGFLRVYNSQSGYIWQEYCECNTQPGQKWVRAFHNGTWESWKALTNA